MIDVFTTIMRPKVSLKRTREQVAKTGTEISILEEMLNDRPGWQCPPRLRQYLEGILLQLQRAEKLPLEGSRFELLRHQAFVNKLVAKVGDFTDTVYKAQTTGDMGRNQPAPVKGTIPRQASHPDLAKATSSTEPERSTVRRKRSSSFYLFSLHHNLSEESIQSVQTARSRPMANPKYWTKEEEPLQSTAAAAHDDRDAEERNITDT